MVVSRHTVEQRTAIAEEVAERMTRGETTAAACASIGRREDIPVNTVLNWYYRWRAKNTPDPESMREAALEMLAQARDLGVPVGAACSQIADQFTNGPTAEQVREWALVEEVYREGQGRAYSAAFRQRAITRMTEMIAGGWSPHSAAQKLADEEYMPTPTTLYYWHRDWPVDDVPESETAADEDASDVEYVDLEAFRAEIEAPLKKQIQQLQAANGELLAVPANGNGASHVDELQRRNDRLVREVTRLRALVQHYLTDDGPDA